MFCDRFAMDSHAALTVDFEERCVCSLFEDAAAACPFKVPVHISDMMPQRRQNTEYCYSLFIQLNCGQLQCTMVVNRPVGMHCKYQTSRSYSHDHLQYISFYHVNAATLN